MNSSKNETHVEAGTDAPSPKTPDIRQTQELPKEREINNEKYFILIG